jgi:hypothetical protein
VISVRRAILMWVLALAMVPLASAVPSSAGPSSHEPELSTPALLDRAVARGELDRAAADRHLIAALRGEPLPGRFDSRAPYDATLVLLDLHARWNELHPTPLGTDRCDIATGVGGTPMPHTLETPHFYIEYNAVALGGGLTIDDYVAALEGSWSRQVDEFGWAAPPPFTPSPAPNNKYPVRIESLGPAIYGYVSNQGTHAGRVGNNPATPWNDADADASCMVLNANFDPFPGDPLVALQATAAHEFNHSIQFGWGALFGGNAPDHTFIEGGATWMEDEVFDDANDNYNYLWPVFPDDMGDYQGSPTRSPYEYWITWRGLTEPYGTGVPGGGEDVMQRFWELTSKGQAGGLEALDRSLDAEGTTLAAAYHAYAIAVKFTKPCGAGYAPPHCLEEGPGYVAARGPNEVHASVAMGQTFPGSLPDNYSLHWISLPAGVGLQAVLRNASEGGRFRASAACDTGTSVNVLPFSAVADAGETVFLRSLDPAACPNPVAVVTNVTQTSANPSSSSPRSYTLSVTPPPAETALKVRRRISGQRILAQGKLRPSGASGTIEVSLFRKEGGWKRLATRRARQSPGGKFGVWFARSDRGRCRVEARFPGTVEYLPSEARSRPFSC